jgi:2-haloacid dehalogenase
MARSSRGRTSEGLSSVKTLAFDVFGTVVDWRGSLVRELRAWGRPRGLDVDWPAFVDAWRAGYRPAMDRVRSGDLPWMNIDALHALILDELLVRFRVRGIPLAEKAHLVRGWHRLRPWPDSVRGLGRLKRGYLVATLSNGNVSLLANMAKNGGLPWDVILSAELFGHYKPDPETYRGAARLLGLRPSQVMMVAAHEDDLVAARNVGLRTAFVHRPREFGPGITLPRPGEGRFDVVCGDIVELARRLGA